MPTAADKRQIDAISKALSEFTAGAVGTIALSVQEDLAAATPKDSGRAAAGWIPSVGSPSRFRSATGRKGAAQGRAEQASGRASVVANRRAVAIHVSSAVPYIEDLDAGHSQKQPAGFVQRAILSGVRKAAARIK